MEAKRVRARVRGRVQGVYYRASTRERAQQLAVTGWVRNRADGTVELEAQGPAAAVDALLAWCGDGPPAARVAGVEAGEIEPIDGERGFAIRR
jgi:acylphosphatase